MIERRAVESSGGNFAATRRMTVSEAPAHKRTASAPGPGETSDAEYLDQWAKTVEDMVTDSERALSRAATSTDSLRTDVLLLATEMCDVSYLSQ